MSNENLSDKNKMILTGRIYPAIQSCVNNRYKIVLGIFAYYGFIFTSKLSTITCKVNFFTSIIFTLFAGHNLWNYWANARDQKKYENGGQLDVKLLEVRPDAEIIFAIIVFSLIWGGHIYFF